MFGLCGLMLLFSFFPLSPLPPSGEGARKDFQFIATEAPTPLSDANWATESITLKNDAVYHGLVIAILADGVQFQLVRQTPGRPTVTLTTFFHHRDIAKIDRLGFISRFVLQAKIDMLDRRHALERQRVDAVQFERLGKDDVPLPDVLVYRSHRFVLMTTTREEIARRAVVRLEQIYAAYERILPPRQTPAAPTTIYLVDTPEAYRALLGPDSGTLLNPAVYDPARNRIICGSDLRRLGEELEQSLEYHRAKFAELQAYEDQLCKVYQNYPRELRDFRLRIAQDRERIIAGHRKNERRFDDATQSLFAILYHEAFHAYVATSVYPPSTPEEIRDGTRSGELPRWLNEGLAQIFETAILEAGELRIGHADSVRLALVQARLNDSDVSGRLLPLSELLKAEPSRYLAAHAEQQGAVDRAYLSAWALTFTLTFEKSLVGHPGFDDYLRKLNLGGDPITTFEQWTGSPLERFEREWHDDLRKLK